MRSFNKLIIVLFVFIFSVNYVEAKEVKYTKKLKRGSIGESVYKLQERLNEVMRCDLEVNGEYDDDTYYCVRDFQNEYDLKVDGIVDKKTYNKLYSDELDEEGDDDFDKLITLGSTGSDVEDIQEKLNEVMKCDLEVDGIFGDDSYNCVINFQKKYNLKKVDGIVGSETYGELFSDELGKENEDEEDKSSAAANKLENNLGKLKVSGNKNIIVTDDSAFVRSGVSEENMVLHKAVLGEVFKYVKVIKNEDGMWYKVKFDDKYKYSYGYIRGEQVRKNFIVVDVSEQKLIYYNGGKVILRSDVVTKMNGNNDIFGGTYVLKNNNRDDMSMLKVEDSNGNYQYIGINSADAEIIYDDLNSNVKVVIRG